jgi:CubicO group peptidase (beta-lactamase class C family)
MFIRLCNVDKGVKMTINGHVEDGFGAVADAFAANLDRGIDLGASLCVYAEGKCVLDLWGGTKDPATGAPWQQDTVATVLSATKGAAAIIVNRLVERGVLGLDAPISQYWPEFAANGKETVTLRMVLSHGSGLPAVTHPISLDDLVERTPLLAALVEQRPFWEPGTAHGYHPHTWGWMLDEVVRRATGESISQIFKREIAGPLGLDFWIGNLPEAVEPRVARLETAHHTPDAETDADVLPEMQRLFGALQTPGSLQMLTFLNPLLAGGAEWDTRAFRVSESPSASGVTNARSLARLYAATIGEVDGARVLSEAAMQTCRTPQASGPDQVIFIDMNYGLGFYLPAPPNFPLGGPGTFGHPGGGGSVGFADPQRGLAFGFVPNRLIQSPTGDPRWAPLLDALAGSKA